jgi:NADPH:quinone reductase-like Zn-dependent oxidoreductase
MTSHLLDRALDVAVLPGYSRLGFALRGLDHESAIAGDLSGRTALVTGGSSGIGEAACEELLAAGATVHLLGRDEPRIRPIAARGTSVIWEAELRLKGARQLLDPLLRLAFNRLGSQAARGLSERLNGLTVPHSVEQVRA